MNCWWQYFKSAFTPDECNWLIEYAKSFESNTATVGHGGKSVVDESIRRSNVVWLSRNDPKLDMLYRRIERMALQSNANAFGFDLAGFHEVQFTEYNADNSGHYDWHIDNSWLRDKPFDRKMSMVMQLSSPDEYTGGELLLENSPLQGNTFKGQGDVIFFPSFNRHKVTPVKLGTRYSLVTWFVGPKFR
jgi:PKHD-type hydroxylase